MIRTISPDDNLTLALNALCDGDTYLVMPGTYQIKSGAIGLFGLRDVSIVGVNNSVIQVAGHGDGILMQDCLRCSIEGLTIRGQDYQTEPNNAYFALIHLEGNNEQLRIENCTLEDSGNHGIGALHTSGPPETNNSIFRNNTILRCGNLKSLAFMGDGAAIAVGGSNNRFEGNVIEDCLRGIELENPYADSFTRGNVITGNRILRSFWHAIVAIPQHGVAGNFAANVIDGNTIIGRGSLDPKALGWDKQQHMISMWGGIGWRITNNLLADSLDWCGVELDPAKCSISDVEITGNTFLHLGRGGVWGQPNGNNSVSNVSVRGNIFDKLCGTAIKIDGNRVSVGDNRYGQITDASGESGVRVLCVGHDNFIPFGVNA